VARFFITGFASIISLVVAWAAFHEARSSVEAQRAIAWGLGCLLSLLVPLALLVRYELTLILLVVGGGLFVAVRGFSQLSLYDATVFIAVSLLAALACFAIARLRRRPADASRMLLLYLAGVMVWEKLANPGVVDNWDMTGRTSIALGTLVALAGTFLVVLRAKGGGSANGARQGEA
jgi:hypothetical protein